MRALAAGLAGVALGALAVTALRPATSPPPGAPMTAPGPDLRAENVGLRRERDALREEIVALYDALQAPGSERDSPPVEAREPDGSAPLPAPRTPASRPADAHARTTPWDAAGLEAAGYRTGDIAALESRFAEIEALRTERSAEMENTPAARSAMREEERGVWADARAELGDADYDALRFASGRMNRVLVQGFWGDAAARTAGTRVGDTIWRIDGQRVFEGQDIFDALAARDRGPDVALEVRRNGIPRTFTLGRKSLGVRFRPVRGAPER